MISAPEHRAEHRAAAARQRDAAYDRGGDHVQLHVGAERVGARVQPRDRDDRRHRQQHREQKKQLEHHALDRDAHQQRRLGVAADRVHVAAEAGSVDDEGHAHHHRAPDQHRYRNALSGTLVGQHVGVHRRHENQQHRDEEERQRRVEPQRPHREAVRLGVAPSRQRIGQQQRAQRRAEQPAQGRAERAVEPAAERQEYRVGHRLRLAVGDEKGRAAKRHQATERDDERRHAEVGREPALVQPDQQGQRQPGQRGRHPVPVLRVHQEGDQHADHAHHRTHRQVDLARDDDQRNRCSDDADDGGLLRDVVQVLRRQEVAGQAMKGDRHHDEHAGHDGQAQVERADLKPVGHRQIPVDAARPPCGRCGPTCRRPAPWRGRRPCRPVPW